MIDDEKRSVKSTPDHKVPARAVPESPEQHSRHQVYMPADWALAVAAQREVKIVAKESGKRHVPSTPELDDVCRLVRRIEVERQTHPEHSGESDGHIGVTREIEIELEAIGKYAAPSDEEAHWFASVEHGRGVFGKIVGYQEFFCQADGEHGDADRKVARMWSVISRYVELGHHLLVMEHRAGDQMGKVSDK